MTRHGHWLGLASFALLTWGLYASCSDDGQATPPANTPVSFIKDVAPILQEGCFTCHDPKRRRGKLDMTTFENLIQGGASRGQAIVAGKPDESPLFELISAHDRTRMPPPMNGEALPKDKINVIQKWIQEGAALDAGLDPKADLMRDLRIRWKPPTPPQTYPYAAAVNTLAFSSDNQKLIVGGFHELLVWDFAAAKLEKRIRTRMERASSIVVLPDGRLVVAGGRPGLEGDIRVYNLQGGTSNVDGGATFLDGVDDPKVFLKELVETDDSVLCLAASSDGKKLAAGGCDKLVRVWDIADGVTNAKLEQTIENHADWVFGVSFSPDNKLLLTSSRDRTAKIWDLTAKTSTLTFPEHQNSVYDVVSKPDGKLNISAGEDGQVRVWNMNDAKQVRSLSGHSKPVLKVASHPKHSVVISCGADNNVRVWNPDTGSTMRVLGGHTDWVYSLAFSSNGDLIASGAWNGDVRIWKVSDGSLVKAFNASPGIALASAPEKKK